LLWVPEDVIVIISLLNYWLTKDHYVTIQICSWFAKSSSTQPPYYPNSIPYHTLWIWTLVKNGTFNLIKHDLSTIFPYSGILGQNWSVCYINGNRITLTLKFRKFRDKMRSQQWPKARSKIKCKLERTKMSTSVHIKLIIRMPGGVKTKSLVKSKNE